MPYREITVSEEVYEKLIGLRRDGEDVSDVVQRLASGIKLSDYANLRVDMANQKSSELGRDAEGLAEDETIKTHLHRCKRSTGDYV